MPTDRGVIFDVDGVLIDSYQGHLLSWQQVAAEFQESISLQQFVQTFGRTSRDIVRECWQHRSFTDAEVLVIDDRKEFLFREIVRDSFPEMPGARRLIRQLAAASFRLAVGSSGPPENVELVLNFVDPEGHVSVRVTGKDVTRGKPDPQVFLLAAKRLGLNPDHCLVVEDAPAGIEAAHRAGMPCIGLISTGRDRHQLAAAELCVPSLEELRVADFEALFHP